MPGERKIYKAGVIDVSALAEAQARDVADQKMTESKEDRNKNWFTRTAKRIWKHNLAQEWYRQREISRAKEKIFKTRDLYAGENTKDNPAAFESAKQAIIERFVSDFENETLKKEEKDSKKKVADAKTKEDIKDLIRNFAGDPSMSLEAFREEQNRILAFANPEYAKENHLYASNLIDIAKEMRAAVIHGEKLADLDFDVEITLGQARESLNTEAQHNAFEKIVEKTQNSRLGKYLFNEPSSVLLAAGLYSAGSFFGMRALRSRVGQWLSFGGTALLAGGVSAAKEAARLNRERAQHMREKAKGMEFAEPDMERREEMEKNRYDTRSAKEILQNLENDLAKIRSGKIKEVDLDAVLVNLSDLETRIKLGDQKKVDLVAYSRFSEMEKERTALDLARAKLKVTIRKGITEGRIDFTKGGTFDDYLQKLITTQSGGVEKGMEAKDRIFSAMKKKRVASAFVKTALAGAAAGLVFQEVQAAFQSGKDGVVEGLIKNWKGEEGQMAGKTTALEGLRRFIMGDEEVDGGRLPFGRGHEMVIGQTHMQLPDDVELKLNSDGTYDILRGGEVVGDNIKLQYAPNGNLTLASRDLLAENGILSTFNQTVDTASEEIRLSADEYVNKHPELTTKIHREVWMDNDTPMYPDPDHPGHLLGADLNELKTHWGGMNGTGIDSNGNYVLNVQHMTDAGSFHDGLSVAAQEQAKKGALSLLLSVTRGTQHEVFKVDIDTNGNAIIDPDGPIGKLMFQNRDGKAIFTGQFAEIGFKVGDATDGGENMQILSTVIGEGRPGGMVEEITHDTMVPNVKLDLPEGEPIDWEHDVPPFIPIPFARRPLEKGKYKDFSERGEGYYGYGGGEGLGLLDRKLYEARFSKRLALDSDFDVVKNDSLLVKEYLAKQDKPYMKELGGMIKSAPKMKPEIETVITVPAYQEGGNIEKTIRNYAKLKNRNSFELVILENHPKNKARDNTKEVVDRMKSEFPDMNIILLYKAFDEKPAIGRVRKYLVDAILLRKQQAGISKSIAIVSNDADLEDIRPDYADNIRETFRKNKNLDAIGGKWDYPEKAFEQFPLLRASQRLWHYFDMVFRYVYLKSPDLIGRNSAFRSGVYAAIGGYNENARVAEDLEIGWLIKKARKYNAERISYLNSASLISNPRRAVVKMLSGNRLVNQYGDFHENEEIRNAPLSELLKDKKDFNPEELKKEVQAIYDFYKRFKNSNGGWVEDKIVDETFDRAMRFLGVKYRKEGEDIVVQDISKLISALEKKKGKLKNSKKKTSEKEPKSKQEDKKPKNEEEVKKTIHDANDAPLRQSEPKTPEKAKEKSESKVEVAPETVETRNFSASFIKETVEPMLSAQEKIKEIKKLEITSTGKEIVINAKVTAEIELGNKKYIKDVTVRAILNNDDGGIVAVKDCDFDVEAGNIVLNKALGAVVGLFLKPKLNKLPELLKSYIENKEGKKVEKVEIAGGELRATLG